MTDERFNAAAGRRLDEEPQPSIGDDEFLAKAKDRLGESGSSIRFDVTSALPRTIGPYRIVSVLGEGGMGIVYEAEQQHPRRPVALKVVRGERRIDKHYVRLFQREAQTLARVRHPHIAAIYESGCTDDGQHFFAMELVRGVPLNQYVRANRLPLRARLKLFCGICDAIHYAHQRGVIHRDLKPSNVLIDADGHPKTLDFGLARMTDSDVAVTTIITEIGKIQGTLPYMSPEQVRGNPDEIDLRSDVYSLGVILYELVTDELPYDTTESPLHETVRAICQDQPRRPRSINRSVRGDLETIILKALAKEPFRRYHSAAALGEDVERFLADQPILARPPSSLYQLRKLMIRHKAASLFVAVLFVLITAFGIWTRVLYRAEQAQRRLATAEAQTTQKVLECLMDLFEAGLYRGTITAEELLERGVQRYAMELKDRPEIQAHVLDKIGTIYRKLGLYKEAAGPLEKALRLRRAEFEEESLEVAESLNSLGLLLQNKGDHVPAMRNFEKALAIHRRLLGDEHQDVARDLLYMGATRMRQGDYLDADRLITEALVMQRKLLDPEEVEVSESLGKLGDLRLQQGEYEEAGVLVRQALEIREKRLGENHTHVAAALSSLDRVLCAKGEYAEAKNLARRVLEIRRNAWGDDHPYVASALSHLGTVLCDQGDYAAAEELFRDALATYPKRLDHDHPYVAKTKSHLGWLLFYKKGDHAEAEQLFRDALAVYRERLREEHPEVIRPMLGLARVTLARGDPEHAEALLRDALAIVRKAAPNDHWLGASVESALGSCLTALGRYGEAEQLVVQSYADMKAMRGSEDRYVGEALQCIIDLYEAWGKLDKADEYRAISLHGDDEPASAPP